MHIIAFRCVFIHLVVLKSPNINILEQDRRMYYMTTALTKAFTSVKEKMSSRKKSVFQ